MEQNLAYKEAKESEPRTKTTTTTTKTNITTRIQVGGRQEQDQLVSYEKVLTIKADKEEAEEEEI